MTCQCIGSHREQFGVESVCRVLITSGLHAARSGCYTARNRSSCARAVSDAVVDERLRVLRRQSFNAALGSRRAWRLLTHPGGRPWWWLAAPSSGACGPSEWSASVRTTRPAVCSRRPEGLARRDFTASRLNRRVGRGLRLHPYLVGVLLPRPS